MDVTATIELGKTKMSSIEYRCLEGPPSAKVIDWITDINQEVFSFDETAESLTSFFQSHRNILICSAFQNGRPIGFKIGFEESPSSFESWRGGIVDSARRQGIARELMRMQHCWCQENNFKIIKTTTNGNNVPMLILNLQSGFEIVGSFMNRHQRLKLLQEKRLVT